MIPLRDSHPAHIFPFWTIGIIALNIYAFFLQITAPDFEAFVFQYALVPRLIDFSDFATLTPFITSQFLHGNLLHIGSNMLFVWVFGDNVEERFGFLFFPVFYLFSGVAAAFAQYILGPDSAIPMLGASGAVAGVLGAYFAMFPHHTIKTLVPAFGLVSVVDIPASVMLVYWFIAQVFSGVTTLGLGTLEHGGVAYFAHIGGFVVGWTFGQMRKSQHVLPA